MNRTLIVITFFLTLSDLTFAQKKTKPLYTAPLGVQGYTFRKSFPNGIAETLDTIKMLGITELEGGGGKMPPEEFKKLCDERGISIPSSGAPYEAFVKDAAGIAERAKILGATYLMCSWIP